MGEGLNRSNRIGCLTAVGLIVVSLVLILAIAGRLPSLDDGQRERARIENEALRQKLAVDVQQKVTLSAWIVRAKVCGGAIALGAVAGLVIVSLRWLNRRAAEIRPDSMGLFPVVRIKVRGVEALHDINKSLTPITVYAPEQLAQQVTIMSLPSGEPAAQERQAARASAVQLVAAQNRHPPILVAGGGRGEAQQVPALEAGDEPERVWPWPSRVPLSGLLNGGGSSLRRLVLGVSINDETGQTEIVTGDMLDMVHVAIGGSSGWGKSMFMQALGYQLALAQEKPDLALVDLEAVTFAPFAQSNRLLYPIADTEQDALAVFSTLADELDRRKALFSEYPGVMSLGDYNSRSDAPIPPIVVLVDEATALLADKGVESALKVLALRGRKYGLWCILGGQDWKASSLDTAIRNQLGARVQFRAQSPSQSRVLLMNKGAEDLDCRGRALAVLPGREMLKLQAPMISHHDIIAALANGGPRSRMPTLDVEQGSVCNDTGPTAEQVVEIQELYAQGESLSEIARRVYGVAGGAAFYKVKGVIEAWNAE